MMKKMGFPIIPGHQNHIALTAIKVDAMENIRKLEPSLRNCLFSDETQWLKLGLHKKYSQSNCFLECLIMYAQKSMEMACTPWYFPFLETNHRMCDPWEAKKFVDLLQSVDLEAESKNYN